MTFRDQPAFNKVVDALLKGRLIVFAGAGISREAGLPSWSGLVEVLRKHAEDQGTDARKLTEIDDLVSRKLYIQAISALKHSLGPDAYARLVEAQLDDRALPIPSTAQAIARMRPHAVLTTNLDRLLERALEGEYEVFVPPVPGNLAQRGAYVLKLHGTLAARRSWILTQDEYDPLWTDHEFRDMLSALYKASTILFVGYGLEDEDFDRLLTESRALSRGQPPIHYAIAPEDSLPFFRRGKFEKSGLDFITYRNEDRTHGAVTEILDALADAREATRSSTANNGRSLRPISKSAVPARKIEARPARGVGKRNHWTRSLGIWAVSLGAAVLTALLVTLMVVFFPSFERAMGKIRPAQPSEILVVVSAPRSVAESTRTVIEAIAEQLIGEKQLKGKPNLRYERAYSACEGLESATRAMTRLSATALVCADEAKGVKLLVVTSRRELKPADSSKSLYDGSTLVVSPTSQVLLELRESAPSAGAACIAEEVVAETRIATGDGAGAQASLDRVIACVDASRTTFEPAERPYFLRAFLRAFVSDNHRGSYADLERALRIQPNCQKLTTTRRSN